MNQRLLLIPVAVIMLGIAFLVGFHIYLDHWSARELPVFEETVFVVQPSETFTDVASTLHEKGIVAPWRFSLRAGQRGLHGSVQSGEYRVLPGETADGLLDRLTGGDVVVHRFLIVEGSTARTVFERLAADDRIDFDLAGVAFEDLMVHLGLPADHPEGQFFPDTYRFKRGHGASALLARANRKMNAVLAKAWQARAPDAPVADPYDALILASIVEKETAVAADQRRIAGVFARRLGKPMRLQSDPTVIYGLGSAYDGNLTKVQLETDGPYNTYRRSGLPPTPIALPGRASIEAALHPEDGTALYFVSRGDGTSQFSDTLDDHNEAVRTYQRR